MFNKFPLVSWRWLVYITDIPMRLLSVRYQQHFLTPQEADHWFIWLQNTTEVHWQQRPFHIWAASFSTKTIGLDWGCGFELSLYGIDHQGSGWPESLESLRLASKERLGRNLTFFCSIDIKWADYMGWHRDDETGCQGDIAISWALNDVQNRTRLC